MSADFNKNGIITCTPMDGYDKVSIMKNDIAVGENLLKNSCLKSSIPSNTTLVGCNNPSGYNFSNESFNVYSSSNGNANNGYGFSLNSVSTYGIVGGTKIAFSIDVKGSCTGRAHVGIWFYGTDDNWWTGSNYHNYFTKFENWTRVHVLCTAPSTINGNKLMLGCHSAISGNFYFKNAKLEIGEKATPWCPSPADNFGSTPSTYKNPIQAKDFIEL